MKIKYRCKFCGIPALLHPVSGEITPLVPEILFEIGMGFHGFIIFLCSLLYSDYMPSFPIEFKEGKQFDRLRKNSNLNRIT